MTYIINKKGYLYLAHSFREGNKVKKVQFYLGRNHEEALKKLASMFFEDLK